MEDNFITVTTCVNQAQAELFRIKLECEGIECNIADEDLMNLTAAVGVRIQVKSADAERAKQILNVAYDEDLSDLIPDNVDKLQEDEQNNSLSPQMDEKQKFEEEISILEKIKNLIIFAAIIIVIILIITGIMGLPGR